MRHARGCMLAMGWGDGRGELSADILHELKTELLTYEDDDDDN
jgi:hypothetical protein